MSQTTLIIVACVVFFVVIPSLTNRTIKIKKLLIGPVVFVYLFFNSLNQDFPIFAISYYLIIVGTLLGIGYLLRKSTTIVANTVEQTVFIKGSFFILYVFLFIFTVHYIAGYLKAVHPEFFSKATIVNQAFTMLFALSSFLTVVSNDCLFIKYLQQEVKS